MKNEAEHSSCKSVLYIIVVITMESANCESVAHHLQHWLNLRRITLTPTDCLCFGYFLSCVCNTTVGEFKVNLSKCRIRDQGCKYLVSGLHKCLDTHRTVTTTLSIVLFDNNIKQQGVSDLSKLLQTDCIKTLNLDSNYDVSDKAVCIIAEELKHNTSLRTLRLVGCGYKSKGVECLASALTTNSSLEVLCCGGLPREYVIEQLAHALRVNHSLKVLHLGNCGMTDEHLESLARSLQHNKSLQQLNISNGFMYQLVHSPATRTKYKCIEYPNTITKKGVSVLTECLKKNNSLLELILPADFESSTTTVQVAVNEARKRSGLPFIKWHVSLFLSSSCRDSCATWPAWTTCR